VAAACFTAAAVLFTGQVRADYWYAGRQLGWPLAFAVSLIDWQLWTLLAPVVLALAARFPMTRPRLSVALAIHLPAGFMIALVKIVMEGALTRALLSPGRIVFGVNKLYMAILVYWILIAAVQFAEQRRVSQAREVRASQLQTELARAEVEALKMQLHPHFLFNTLNAISGLMREDVEAADLMLTQLGELLRKTLETEGRQEVPLADEIQWLQTYLTIQQTRFGERLRVDIDVPADCQAALVPTLILQPIVENAIRHGFGATPGPGRVTIAARREDGRLRIDVADEGPGAVEPLREGYGLRNTRARLRVLHADAASLVVERRAGGRGTVSRLDLPLRLGAAA